MRTFWFISLAIFASGSAFAEDGNSRAVGRYIAVGLNSNRILELRADGAFLMRLHVTNCDAAQQDTEERGTWVLNEDVVTLRPNGREKYGDDIWYARLLLKTEDKHRKLICGVPGEWAYKKLGFDEEPEANNTTTDEILGNSEPELHAHIFPRFSSGPDEKRRLPAWFYDWKSAPRFSTTEHGDLLASIRASLTRRTNQLPQRTAGSSLSSYDSPASQTPTSLGPRG